MFLILGSPRSGTTLLRATLNQHPAMLVPDETDFIVPVCIICDRVMDEAVGRVMIADLITRSDRYAFSLAPYLTTEDVRAVVTNAHYSGMAIVEALYDTIGERHGKARVGDKSPNDLFFLELLLRGGLLERPIKVIHLVRDIRDVVHSLSRTAFRPPFLDAHFPVKWSHENLQLFRLMHDLPEQYLLVRFDDMVLEAEATFQKITSFLGVSYSADMLSPHTRGLEKTGQVEHRNLDRPMLSQRVAVWRREMDSARSSAVAARAAEALCQFGWEKPETVAPSVARPGDASVAVENENERTRLWLEMRLNEQMRWARLSAAEVTKRDAVIVDLQGQLEGQAEWAKTSADEVGRRDTIIQGLQASLDEHARWAQMGVEEVAKRDAIIVDLQGQLGRQAEWAMASADGVVQRDTIITTLQASLDECARWAQRSAEEVARRDETIADLRQTVGGHERLIQELNGRLQEARRVQDEILRLERPRTPDG